MSGLSLQLMRFLAVAGGAALGYVLIGGILAFLGRFVFRNKLPPIVPRALRLLGGLAGALLVWYWVGGVGGGGPGGGGGIWPFGGSGSGGTDTRPAETPPKSPKDAGAGRGEAVEVEMLGGPDVTEQRFYKLEGEARPLTFAE